MFQPTVTRPQAVNEAEGWSLLYRRAMLAWEWTTIAGNLCVLADVAISRNLASVFFFLPRWDNWVFCAPPISKAGQSACRLRFQYRFPLAFPRIPLGQNKTV